MKRLLKNKIFTYSSNYTLYDRKISEYSLNFYDEKKSDWTIEKDQPVNNQIRFNLITLILNNQ